MAHPLRGRTAIVGVGHCSTCAPAVSTHAITLETKYGVPAVAIHTEKFDKVVKSVAKMGGLPQAALVKAALERGLWASGNETRLTVDGITWAVQRYRDPTNDYAGSVTQEVGSGPGAGPADFGSAPPEDQ